MGDLLFACAGRSILLYFGWLWFGFVGVVNFYAASFRTSRIRIILEVRSQLRCRRDGRTYTSHECLML
jgi:hypothetical protein